jgi:hypothetical protein
MERTTLATTGLELEPPASAPEAEVAAAAASCQERETMGGHFMSHTERSDRAVSRCLATPAIAAVSAVFQRVVWFNPGARCARWVVRVLGSRARLAARWTGSVWKEAEAITVSRVLYKDEIKIGRCRDHLRTKTGLIRAGLGRAFFVDAKLANGLACWSTQTIQLLGPKLLLLPLANGLACYSIKRLCTNCRGIILGPQ